MISPLRVEPDQNDVNLVSGKTTIDVPVISVPAAPNLRFDRIQNAAPYVNGRITGSAGNYPVANYSVHAGGGTSESFVCPDYDCAAVTGSGSTFQHSSRIYRQVGSGARWNFDVFHVDQMGPPRVLLYYASSVTYPNGEVISYTYDTAYLPDYPNRPFRRPVTITSNMGYFISITYQPGALGEMGWNNPAQVTLYANSNPTTPLQRLTYNSNGTQITDLGGRVYQCTGCSNSLGLDLEVAAGSTQLPTEGAVNRQVTAHATAPVVASVTDDGVGWSYTYLNLRSQPTTQTWLFDRVTVTGPNGFNQVYQIAQIGSPTQLRNVVASVTDSIGRTTSYSYDPYYRPVTVVAPEGNSIDVAYDDYGNLYWRRTRPKPGSGQPDIIEQAYFPGASLPNLCTVLCWRPTWTRDGLNRQTDYVYNSSGQLTERTDPADANGVRRRTIVEYALSPAGISRKSVVRICGVGTTCGTNQEIRTEYQYLGDTLLPTLERQVDPATGQYLDTAYSYDPAGRLLSTDGPLPGTDDATFNRYDVHGRKTWEIGARGANNLRLARRFTYRDSDDKPISTETGTVPDPNGTILTLISVIDVVYDNRSNPVRETTSAGGSVQAVVQRSFDDRGRVECEARRMNPGAFGSLPASACSLGATGAYGPDRITRNVYDAAGQLLQVQRAYGITTANGFAQTLQQNEATYSYSPNGRRTSVIDANGNRAELTWDGYDRQRRWIFPSPSSTGVANQADYEEYGYDAVGNRTSLRKRDGSTLIYQYDNLNRMILKIVPERAGLDPIHSRDVYYAYDLRNQQTEARFDSLSGDGVSSGYDAFGRQISSTTRWGAIVRTLGYGYDQGSRRTGLTHPDGQAFTYGYSPAGELVGVYQGVGTGVPLATFGYNPQALISSRSEGGGSGATYSYDPLGRVATLTDTFAGGTGNVAVTLGYNPVSQIVQRTRSNDAYASNTAYNVTRAYTVNGLNQYSAAGTASFTYDANGNLISDGTNSFTYDVENRLVARSGGVSIGYDPLGRLAWSTGSPNFTRFLHDGDALVAEYDYSGNLVHRYVHGSNTAADDPLIWYDGATTRWLHANHQGSIVAVTNASGAAQWINAYDEWGIPNAANQGRFQYTGQAWMAELGMYYYKARIYSPTLGRFLQVDPIGYDGGVNLYAYVGNDPVNRVDPTGLADVDYMTQYDGAGFQRLGRELDLPNTVVVLSHGSPIARQTGVHQYTNVPTTRVAADINAASRTQRILLLGCRLGSNPAGMQQIREISRLTGNRPIMASTTQTYFGRRNGSIFIEAYRKNPDGTRNRSQPGEFRVFNGSYRDFGLNVPAGYVVRGFRVNERTGETHALLEGSETGSRLPRRMEELVDPDLLRGRR